MPKPTMVVSFRPLVPADLAMLHDWICRPHVARWWGPQQSFSDFEADFLPLTDPKSSTRGYVALLQDQPIGFIQSYVVMGSGAGWWENETDSGARGIDQFLANEDQLGRGLGSNMVRAFVDQLLSDPSVSKVQTDPSPHNERAIRCYLRAGFQAGGHVVTPDGPALLMIRHREKGTLEGDEQHSPSIGGGAQVRPPSQRY